MSTTRDQGIRCGVLAVAVLVFGLAGGHVFAQELPNFDVVEVAPYPGFYPGDLNNRGEVVGENFVEFPDGIYRRRAVHWADGVLTFLDVDPTRASFAQAINDNGEIIGVVFGSIDEFDRLFLFNPEDGIIDPYLDDQFDGNAQPDEINNEGQVTFRNSPPGVTASRPFFWDGTEVHALLPETALGGEVSGLNNLGEVVGRYDEPYGDEGNYFQYGFVWSDGSFETVGAGGESVSLADINDVSQAIGTGYLLNGGEYRAFLYEGVELQNLGALGGSYSAALSINNNGWIVGEYSRAEQAWPRHAFLVVGSIMYDLNDLVPTDLEWELTRAEKINDRGQILVWGSFKETGSITFLLLTPSAIDMVEELIGLIEGYGLPRGIENSFLVKLEHALEAIADGDVDLACNQLNAFANHVIAQTGKKLTEEQAAELLEGVENVRVAIGCP